jgi:hypothetical protein
MLTYGLAQTVLAALFSLHGIVLLVLPAPVRRHMSSMPGGPPFFRFIGVAEVLAALGLTVPRWTGLMPWFVPLAAIGLLPIMFGAAYFHGRQAAWPQVAADLVVVAFVSAVVYISF